MLKTVCLVLTLIIVFAESSPINVSTVEFDNLNLDYPDLGYERDENWGAVFSRLIGDPAKNSRKYAKASRQDSDNLSAKTSGSEHKSQSAKDVNDLFSNGDLNAFFKDVIAYDQGTYDDAGESARAAVTAAAAAATKGKAIRTYARGNKTNGFHRVYHKDEYKKDQDFYELDETKGAVSSADGKITGATISADAGFRKGSLNHNRHKGIHGKEGTLNNGFVDQQFSEFEDNEDLDGEFSNFK